MGCEALDDLHLTCGNNNPKRGGSIGIGGSQKRNDVLLGIGLSQVIPDPLFIL